MNQNETSFCDICEKEKPQSKITPTLVYDENGEKRIKDVCVFCYKNILQENKHVHPDNRL
jgi:hypothetical protein